MNHGLKLLVCLVFLSGCIGAEEKIVSQETTTTSTATFKATTTTTLGEKTVFVEVVEGILTKDKKICSTEGGGVEQCDSIYALSDDTPAYSVITYGICPLSDGENALEVEIFNSLDDGSPPKGSSRAARYCKKTNLFWVLDYSFDTRAHATWYGPYAGYPKARKTHPRGGKIDVCEGMNASFWKALCYDREAIEKSDPDLCGTVYCLARLKGASFCDNPSWMSAEWYGFRKRACEAYAAKTHFICDPIPMSRQCIQWYAMLSGNLTLCRKTEKVGDDCIGDFAFWRGDAEVCNEYKTLAMRQPCEGRRMMMEALDGADESVCGEIAAKRELLECRKFVNTQKTEKTHPLFEFDKQIVFPLRP